MSPLVSAGIEGGSLNSLWNINCDEPLRCVEVVLAAFIDDSDVPLPLRFVVRNDYIDLVAFQRRLIPLVHHTDGEPASPSCISWTQPVLPPIVSPWARPDSEARCDNNMSMRQQQIVDLLLACNHHSGFNVHACVQDPIYPA